MDWTGNNGDMFNAGRIGIQGGQDSILVRTDPIAIHFQDHGVFDWLLFDRCRSVIDPQRDERV